jgi:hypothetical protein
MAIMKGPFHLQGKIGDLRYYYNRAAKKWCVSGKGGANKDIVANNPNMVHNRENNNEFKAVGKWSSLLRKALIGIDHLNKGYYMKYVVKIAKLIQKKDIPGVMGQRNIFSSRFKSMLLDINFNEEHPFSQVFSHRVSVNADPSRKAITLSILDLVSYFEISWPKPFEWYRITMVIAQQPDYLWSSEFQIYDPAYPLLFDRSIVVRSEWLKRSRGSVDIALSASFRENELSPDDVSVVVAMGVELAANMVGDSFSASPGNGTMAIVACL